MAQNPQFRTHEKIKKLLNERSIHDAIMALENLPGLKKNPAVADLLGKQKETYKYMIHYTLEGFIDEGRVKTISDIISSLQFINDYLLREALATDSSDIYFSTLRLERLRHSDLKGKIDRYRKAQTMDNLSHEANGSSEFRKEADEALSELFDYVWTMYGDRSSDYEVLLHAMKDPDLPFEFKSQIISALLLGNLKYFDRKGLDTLLDIYDADISPRLTARAMTAIVMILAANAERINSDMALSARLETWKDSIVAYRQLREIVMSLIRARDTERISNKMKNEVLPELMKLRPEILSKFRSLSENSDLSMLEENPEWEEIMSKNGLGDKLKELTEMQMDGGDVMMMAFSNLKSYPFFNSVSNWFLPFSTRHHELPATFSEDSGFFYKFLDMEGVMCDSDKFSFALSLSRMPEEQRKMITEKMDGQMDQLKEALADKRFKSSAPEFDTEVTRYVRDIYRFFKLSRRKNDFIDPFAAPLDFMSLPIVNDILANSEILNLVGTFYFKRGYYTEALPILLKLDSETSGLSEEDPQLWEKIGYCYHALGKIEKALEWYRKAEFIHPDSKWLLKKIAVCFRLLEKYVDAAEYYAKALEFSPENHNLLINFGYSLAESGKYQEALVNFYHADYVKPDQPQTLRAIAWVELLNGDFGKSMEVYQKLKLIDETKPSDLINEGHSNLLSGNLKGATTCYRLATKTSGFSMEDLEKELLKDSDSIELLKPHKEMIRLILDNIKFEG